MGKNKKKEYVLDAVLDEETYMAYKSGQAIDNNGLRSPKGSYWPTLEFGIDTFHKYSANAAQILPPLKKCVDQHIELAVNIFKKSGQMTRLILI